MLLLIHGLAQSHLSFVRKFESALARTFRLVSFDLRGHGLSDKPTDAGSYQDGRRWADDLRAVMAQMGLVRPVLVGWSLGGRVIRQYLMHHGDAALGGINIVSARPIEDATIVGAVRASADPAAGLGARIRSTAGFLRACYATPPEGDDFEAALAFNMLLPWEVRGHTT